jgi:hypothetical protein
VDGGFVVDPHHHLPRRRIVGLFGGGCFVFSCGMDSWHRRLAGGVVMSKMLIDRAAVEQALKTIESWNPSLRTDDDEAAVTALRAALEQPEQEPVGDSYADLFNALQRIETAARGRA